MAQMTPEEFLETLETWAESLKNGTVAQEEDSEALLRKIGVTKELQKEFSKLGKSTVDMTKSLYHGKQGAEAMAGGFDMVADAIQVLIAVFLPGSLLLKAAISVTVGAIKDYATAAAKQGDATYKAFQDLNRVGASGVGGLTTVFDNMQKFGYGIEELDKMVALVAANSDALAKFGGTAAQGTDAFAEAMNQLTHGETAIELESLGKHLDDINAAGAAYIRLQLQLGKTQKDIGDGLAAGTKSYIYDLNRLQELTGASADNIAKKQQEAFADSAYAALMNRLSKGTDADQAQAKKIRDIESLLKEASPEQAKLFRRGIGGDVGAQGSLNFTAPSLMRDARSANTDFVTTIKNLNRETKQFVASASLSYENNAEGMDAVGGKMQDLIAVSEITENIEERLAKTNQATTDNGVKNIAETKVLQREARDSLQTFVQLGVNPATDALKIMARAAAGVTSVAPGTPAGTGAGKASAIPGTPAGAGKVSATPGTSGSLASVQIGDQTRTGGDRNWRNNNPGNIEYGKFAISMGAIGSDGRFAIFPTEEMGRKAADTLLKGKNYANLSAGAAIAKWAPSNENDPKAYAASIAKATGLDMGKKYADMSPQEQAKFLAAMTKVEGGRAGSISGPSGGYDSKMAGVSPSSTLESYDSAQARAAANNQNSNADDERWQKMQEHFETQTRAMITIADNTGKTTQAIKAQ